MTRTSPLNDYHEQYGGRMIDFAGWTMPICYDWPGGGGGITAEHVHTRNAVGFFDVSHMGRVYFKGRHARRLVEMLVTRRVTDMQHGQCRYALCLNEAGGVKDDVLVYRLAEDRFMLVVNAANREKLVEHFERVKAESDFTCEIDDKTLSTAMVAAQGPRTMEIVSKVSSEIPTLKRYRFTEKNLMVMKLLASRTGYTGEDGVEVILPAKAVGIAIKMFLKDAKQDDSVIKPCGLGARDTLRLEAGMALYGHELSEETNALETGLGFAMNLDKGDGEENVPGFIGQDALNRLADEGGPSRSLVGLELDSKRTARQGMAIAAGGEPAGVVTSGCTSPTLGKSIAMGYVDRSLAATGTSVDIDMGKGRSVTATVFPMPFYKAPKPEKQTASV
jgi:aminomethyltransferase